MKLSKTLLLSPLIFLAASPVQAENQVQNRIEERREVRQEIIENRQEVRQEIQENRQNLRGTMAQDRLQFRRENAIKIANNIVSKLELRFEYLNKVKARLQSKIDSLKSSKNMTEAQTKLNSYNSAKYTADLASLKSKIDEINTAEKPNMVIPSLRETSKLVQKDLKDLHQVLVDSLKLIVKAPKISE